MVYAAALTIRPAVREVADQPYGAAAGPDEWCSAAAEEAPGPAPAAPDSKAVAWEADPDAVEALGDEIATLAAHIHAATQRLLSLIAEFDRARGWEPGGHRSCSHWLSFRAGLDLGTAREHVRVARALEALPLTSQAMARGKLSFSKVRALTRVATPETESDLLELAVGSTAAELERAVRGWKRGGREEEAERARRLHEARELSVFPDEEGGYAVRGRLEGEVGALLLHALEAAGEAIFREKGPPAGEREVARRRADALALLAERALAAGFGREGEPEAPLSGTRAERYQVVVHVDSATLAAEGEPGRSELEDGTRVSAETSRRLACDAAVLSMTHAADGSVLDLGRKTRTVSPALRRALEARDRGCRFPGCGLRFTDAHHLVHWADGGKTSLRNTLLLCSHHHRLVHEGGWRVEWYGRGKALFRGPGGRACMDGGWRPPELSSDPVGALVGENRRRGVKPDGDTAGARWKSEVRIPFQVLLRATETALRGAPP